MAADDGLKVPVVVTALGINAASLPAVFSQAYQYYVLSQSTDFVNVAGKANEAGQGAYDAQVKNDEQDAELADHEQRIDAAELTIANHEQRIKSAETQLADHETRITTNESDILALQTDVTAIQADLADAKTDIDNLQADYVSKSATASQSLASPLNVTTSYSVDGVKVIGAQRTGWTPSTGTALLGAFNANQAFIVSDPPTQVEIQAIATALVANRQRTKALEDAMRSHGLIN